jgi:hypothetical protein
MIMKFEIVQSNFALKVACSLKPETFRYTSTVFNTQELNCLYRTIRMFPFWNDSQVTQPLECFEKQYRFIAMIWLWDVIYSIVASMLQTRKHIHTPALIFRKAVLLQWYGLVIRYNIWCIDVTDLYAHVKQLLG